MEEALARIPKGTLDSFPELDKIMREWLDYDKDGAIEWTLGKTGERGARLLGIVASEWAKKDPVAASDPKAQDKKNTAQAKPEIILNSFPPSSDLSIDNKTALCVIELANIFLALKQTERALDLADKVGRKYMEEAKASGLPQVLASETSGDIMIESRLYEKSISFYELALKFLEKYRYDHKEEGKSLDLIQNRISKKLETSRRLFDIERYGEGFVLYREAETKRLTDKSPA